MKHFRLRKSTGLFLASSPKTATDCASPAHRRRQQLPGRKKALSSGDGMGMR